MPPSRDGGGETRWNAYDKSALFFPHQRVDDLALRGCCVDKVIEFGIILAVLHIQVIPTLLTGPQGTRLTPWMPYVIAACLMAVGICQMKLIMALDQQVASVRTEVATLKQSNALMGLRLTTLEAKDAAYGSARVMVAWDPHLHRGVVSFQKLPVPPTGRDYQLWVLDPNAETPINAGLIAADVPSRPFAVGPVSVAGPGFALSLEPSGGRPAPTGSILFAVPPEE